jgi:pyruvate,water dikinase
VDTIVWFDEEDCRDVAVAGGKGASLAAMTAEGLPVPPGFVVRAGVLSASVDADRLLALVRGGDHAAARAYVLEASPPGEQLASAHARLGDPVAVRSSACAEDSASASYAGQQETFLGVRGVDELLRRVVDCWASFFTEHALFYRRQMGSLEDLGMAVVVQRMVDAEKAGVVFTVDPVQRRRDQMVIEAVLGLGEQVVSGEARPDHYVVTRQGAAKRTVTPNGGVLDDEELEELAALGRLLEERFGCPQDIEWAIESGKVYLLQSRPVTAL